MAATVTFLAYRTYRDAQLVARPLSPS